MSEPGEEVLLDSPTATAPIDPVERLVALLSHKLCAGPLLLLLTLLAASTGYYWEAIKLPERCGGPLMPSPYLESWTAYSLINRDFGTFLWERQIVTIQQPHNGSSVLGNATRALVGGWKLGLEGLAGVKLDSYYDAPGPVQYNYISSDRTKMIVMLMIQQQQHSLHQRVAAVIESGRRAGLIVQYSETLGRAHADSANFAYNHVGIRLIVLLPIAVVLFVTIGSLRLLVIPTVALAVVITTAGGITSQIAAHNPMPIYQPTILIFLAGALTINYTSFMLTRWQEERRVTQQSGDESMRRPVVLMLQRAGNTVCASGCILMVVWLALCCFPCCGIQSSGVSSAITVLLATICSLTICPAILLVAPQYFSNAATHWNLSGVFRPTSCVSQHQLVDLEGGAAEPSDSVCSTPSRLEDPAQPIAHEREVTWSSMQSSMQSSWYYRVSGYVTGGPIRRVLVSSCAVLGSIR